MDAEVAAFAELFASIDIADLPDARAKFSARGVDADEPEWAGAVDVTEREVPVPDPAAPGVPVRIYAPRGRHGALPAVLYFHGGSFVAGDLDTNHHGCGEWARSVGALVINVGYRLAPEAPYPAALEDCYAVLRWVAGAAAELGVDGSRIAVSGSSAGGGLAAAVAILSRDRGGPAIALQLLNYPMLDDRCDSRSMQLFTDTPVYSAPAARLAWRYYLGGGDRAEASPYAAPARAADLSGLPPAFVLTCEYDPLRDEGLRYACALLAAGVPVELHQFAGSVHGFDAMPTALSAVARTCQVSALQRALRTRPVPVP